MWILKGLANINIFDIQLIKAFLNVKLLIGLKDTYVVLNMHQMLF